VSVELAQQFCDRTNKCITDIKEKLEKVKTDYQERLDRNMALAI
jgi:hypothetical protein